MTRLLKEVKKYLSMRNQLDYKLEKDEAVLIGLAKYVKSNKASFIKNKLDELYTLSFKNL